MGNARRLWKDRGKDRAIAVARRLLGDRRGVALIEMAFALPIQILLLFGIISYGSWLALAHAVQQSANEGARSALGGLTQAERATLARTSVQTMLARSYRIDPRQVAVTIEDDGATLVVDVTYDASANALLSLPLVPLPSRTIERKTAVRLTGL